MDEEVTYQADGLYHINGKRTGSQGAFLFYTTRLEVIKLGRAGLVGGALFGMAGAAIGSLADQAKQQRAGAEFVLPYADIRRCYIDKSLMFGNGISIETNNDFSIKLDIPPKHHFDAIRQLLGAGNRTISFE